MVIREPSVEAAEPESKDQPARRPAKQRRKGPRPKHVPRRTCVACRESGAKRSLIRLVRTPDGTAEVDTTGKRPGRGAYLCNRFRCWEAGANAKVLGRALALDALSEENRAALLKYADERVPEVD